MENGLGFSDSDFFLGPLHQARDAFLRILGTVFDVKQVREEVTNPGTGTTFLLTGSGLFLVRRPAVEWNNWWRQREWFYQHPRHHQKSAVGLLHVLRRNRPNYSFRSEAGCGWKLVSDWDDASSRSSDNHECGSAEV